MSQTSPSNACVHVSCLRTIVTIKLLLSMWLVLVTASDLRSQEPSKADPAAGGMIKITLPPDAELKNLIDFVSVRLGVQILYDESVANKRISINAPQPIPADTLLDVLRSALKMKGLALTDAEVKGWKRIVLVEDLSRIAETDQNGRPLDEVPGAVAVTQTFTLTHLSPTRIKTIIEPFLSKSGANTIPFPDKNLLIVTDYAANLRRIGQLISAIDQAGPERTLSFYQVKHVNAVQLAQQVTLSITSRLPPGEQGIVPPIISAEKRTNQLLIVGTAEQVDEAMRLTKAFDVELDQRTEIYSFRFVRAERIDKLVKSIFDPIIVERLYRSSIDNDDNLLIVTATEEIHERIVWFKKELDIETKRPSSGVKFYRLKYADAKDVLNTLRAIDQRGDSTGSTSDVDRGVSSLGRGGVNGSQSNGQNDTPINFVPGPNTPNQPGQPAETPPAMRQGNAPNGSASAGAPGSGAAAVEAAFANTRGGVGSGTIVPGNARVSMDQNTNSIVVIADRSVQQVYEELIKFLDKPRPQIMIEAKVVTLNTSDNFSLGVEVSGGDRTGLDRMFQFTSYGLSTVTPTTGALALIPGQGFNWTLVDTNSADAVIRALATHNRAKVVSAPQILVNDNATGTLASVSEVPFTSVNASNTVATTSFAGFAEAGTTIKATPRITDDSHLELKYNVALNSFTGTGSAGVPPPRQTDQIQSTVVVPDGYTVIVGGLTRQNYSKTLSAVPILETIPVLNYLSSSRTKSASQTTLFVFLRPVILRDDKFRDLKFLSDRALPKTGEAGNYPASTLKLIKSCRERK